MDRLTGSRKYQPSPWCRNRTKSNGEASYATGSMHSASSSEDLCLFEFSDDLLLHIFQFCSVQDIRQLSRVNHRFRSMFFSADAFWWDFCHRTWKWLPEEILETTDSLDVPGDVVEKLDEMNMLALLSMAAEKGPPSIDKRALQPVIKNPLCWLRATARDFKLSLREIATNEGDTAIQYTGRVGEGDRSFRSEYPLPHPTLLTQRQLKTIRRHNKRPFFFYKQQDRPIWAPFVSPYMAGHVPDVPRPVVNMTPRLISYFEATILSPPQETAIGEEPGAVSFRTSRGESVGIGLATERFRWYKRMPGWDKFSYGYHGDDGGLFQGSPQILHQYGPPFGVGDTIGCGLDYQRRSIFFTWHGVFLGYAFDNLSLAELQKDFYPAIGVDSNSPVSCNFGCKKPFVFDLNSMVCHQRKVIMKTLLPAKRKILLGKRSKVFTIA